MFPVVKCSRLEVSWKPFCGNTGKQCITGTFRRKEPEGITVNVYTSLKRMWRIQSIPVSVVESWLPCCEQVMLHTCLPLCPASRQDPWSNQGMKPLKLWIKIHFALSSCFISGTLYMGELLFSNGDCFLVHKLKVQDRGWLTTLSKVTWTVKEPSRPALPESIVCSFSVRFSYSFGYTTF